jgi:FMN phosphatase YigB (HAD superfamily)
LRTRTSAAAKISFGACNLQNGYKWIDKWNLALPYGEALLSILPDAPDAVILSFEVGPVKPDPAIFHLVCDGLGIQLAEILFVGDTPAANIESPRDRNGGNADFGFRVVFDSAIQRGYKHGNPNYQRIRTWALSQSGGGQSPAQ